MEMPLISYFQTNGFALAVLLMIFIGVWRRSADYPPDQKIFLGMLASNALLLVFDTAMWAFAGQSSAFAMLLHPLATSLYFMLQPLPCILWLVYADLQINRRTVRKKAFYVVIAVPTAINALLSASSYWTGIMFRIHADNTYSRSFGLYISLSICYFYLVVVVAMLIRGRKLIRREEYGPLLLFILPPSLGALIQVFYFGVALVWTSMAISMLLIYLKVLNRRLYTDHLTGLHNRRQLDDYLNRRVHEHNRKIALGGIMIDVNLFKQINDQFGHATGDDALESTSDILRESLRSEDFICRYGGDEFAVIMDVCCYEDLSIAVDRIRKTAERFNSMKKTPYEISLSCGFDVFDPLSGMTASSFLDHLDRLMYQNKKKNSTTKQDLGKLP